MKVRTIRTFYLLIIPFILLSCDNKPYSSSLTLNVNQEIVKKDKSILPEDIPLEVTQYSITGQGPNEKDTFSISTRENKTTVKGLTIGTWDIFAVGKNADDLVLVSGSKSVKITKDPTTTVIELDTLVGTGNISLTFNWDPDLITNPKLELNLTNQNNEKIVATPSSIDYSLGVASFDSVEKAGSYTINSKLYDGEVLLAGCIEAIRVVMNKTSSGIINFTLNEDSIPETSDDTIVINNQAGVPISCTIEEVNEVIPYNQKIYPKLVENNDLPLNELSISWYLDGSLIGSGINCSLSPSLGFHRLDVVVDNGDLGSTSSASKEFEVTLNAPAYLPKVVATINHGDNGFYVGNNMHICYLPDNKIISYCGDTNTLQICRIINNRFEVLNTYNNSSEMPLSNVVDMKVDKIRNRVFISDETSNTISIYDYSYNKLNKYFYDDTYHKYAQHFGSIFIRPEDFLVFDHLGDSYREYAIDPILNSKFFAINMVKDPDDYSYHCTKGIMSPNQDAITFCSDTGYVSHAYNTPGYNNCLLRATGPLEYDIDEVFVAAALNWKTFLIGANNRIIEGSLMGEDLNFSTELCEIESYVSESYGLPNFENVINFIYYTNYNNINNDYDLKKIYALCSGSNSLLAFDYDETDYSLTYIGKEDLSDFTPENGVLSNDKETLILWGNNEKCVKLCKINK
ncbi:MAG: hypothetical protein ACPKM0_08090 [Pleomorphochaeta sp.]